MDSNSVPGGERQGRPDCCLENGSGTDGEPEVRIHLPPAESRRQPNLLARGPGLEVAAPIDCEPPVGLGYAPPQPRDRARGGARASPGNGAVHLHESVLGTAIHFGVMANPINVIGVVIRRPQLWVTVE